MVAGAAAGDELRGPGRQVQVRPLQPALGGTREGGAPARARRGGPAQLPLVPHPLRRPLGPGGPPPQPAAVGPAPAASTATAPQVHSLPLGLLHRGPEHIAGRVAPQRNPRPGHRLQLPSALL